MLWLLSDSMNSAPSQKDFGMRLSSTTLIAPPKIALSRQERFLETACYACRACWGGLVILGPDGAQRDHFTCGLSEVDKLSVRQLPAWFDVLRAWSRNASHKCGRLRHPIELPDLPPLHSTIGVSWPIYGNSRAVLYVVRTQGEAFGPAEEVALQGISRLLVQESQQDESHLIAKMRVLNQVAQTAASLRDVQQLFSLALAELERHIPSNCGVIWLLDDVQHAATVENVDLSRLRVAGADDRAQKLGLTKDMPLSVAGSIFEACVQQGAANYLDAGELKAAPCTLARVLIVGGASATFALPLRAGQRLLGILQCICLRPDGFTNEQIQLYYLVADLLGPAIAQALWLQRLVDANNELRATHAQLVQSEKIRALGEMASGMAHDFNNSLCGVLGFLDLALLEESLPISCRTYLESSKTCALDAAQTVRRVQDFARRQHAKGELEPIEFDDLVRQTVELTRPKWESLARVDRPVTAEVNSGAACLVRGSPSELREAITNLIFNAVDAMPHGGKLTIQTWIRSNEAYLAIRDTGIGIAEDAKRRLFEPFFTTKGERGNGLGLSVTFGIIQRHHGHIEVDSQAGRGATFTVRLPIWADAAQAASVETEPEIVLPQSASQVLVVEDEESIRRFLSAGLEQLGYQSQTAPSAEEALDVLSAKKFDVILTDLGLPGMSGAELARTVQQRSPGTPVVLLTGWGEQIQAENQQIDGVVEILAKPVTIKKLATTLASVCAL